MKAFSVKDITVDNKTNFNEAFKKYNVIFI